MRLFKFPYTCVKCGTDYTISRRVTNNFEDSFGGQERTGNEPGICKPCETVIKEQEINDKIVINEITGMGLL